VAIRFSNRELAPFWGAGARFALAAVVYAAMVTAQRRILPRGSALIGAVLYGLLGFAAFFAFGYWGLVRVPAGLGTVILALGPLVTLFFAVAHGLERFRWRAFFGAVVAAAGVAVVFGDQVSPEVPLMSLLAILAAAVCFAEASIVVKRLPPTDPVATNAVAVATGAIVLLALSVFSGEPHVMPVRGATWTAFVYLVSLGTVGTFLLFLFVLRHLPASTVSYQFVLAPFVAAALGWWLAGEVPTPISAAGALLVLAGVYIGALAPLGRGN
jgi:drug/metabolite transporter (DMT)-like permease